MIKMDKVEELIKKLNVILSVDGDKPSVSPTATGSITGSPRDTLIITPDLDLEKLSDNDALFVHVMLHQLYASRSKSINREDIRKLHSKIRERINHSNFDELDRNDK